MFLQLLSATLALAAATSAAVALLFAAPIRKILDRLVSPVLAPAWRRYILYAVVVVGTSGGVRLWDLDRYITPDKEGRLLALTTDRWVVEVAKTVLGALQSSAWMLLVFFLFALVAYVVVRGFEARRPREGQGGEGPS